MIDEHGKAITFLILKEKGLFGRKVPNNMTVVLHACYVKDVRVHAPIRCIKLGIPIYFIDHSEFITVQCKKILSRANNEIKCFEFSSIKRALRSHLRTIIAI